MIDGRSVLALIPARGGSKGLPGKNILEANGRPLLAWSIDAARAARCVDRVVVSTDDDAIAAAARNCGCEVPFRRPAQLAGDTTPAIDVALHALGELPDYDIVVLLQPTSPLRTAADIDAACARMIASNAASCVSVCAARQNPHWMYFIDAAQHLRPVVDAAPPITRRQDLPPAYVLNGAVYVADVRRLRLTRAFVDAETVAYVMPPERSLDIDTPADFERFRSAVAPAERRG